MKGLRVWSLIRELATGQLSLSVATSKPARYNEEPGSQKSKKMSGPCVPSPVTSWGMKSSSTFHKSSGKGILGWKNSMYGMLRISEVHSFNQYYWPSASNDWTLIQVLRLRDSLAFWHSRKWKWYNQVIQKNFNQWMSFSNEIIRASDREWLGCDPGWKGPASREYWESFFLF